LWATAVGIPATASATAIPQGHEQASEAAARGRPKIVLDRLELPEGSTSHLKRHLRTALLREARRADWGAGRGNKIELRYRITELEVRQDGSVVHVFCAALGQLPRGKSARGQLSFGGDVKRKRQVVERVVEIVARGVITRLAEMERRRRGGRLEHRSARQSGDPG